MSIACVSETLEQDENPLVDEDLLEEMIRAVVDHPDEVRVEAIENDGAVELRIHVHAEDRRHVIGRQGRMVMLLRQFFGVIAVRQNRRTTIEVVEPDDERALRRGAKPPPGDKRAAHGPTSRG